MRGACRFSESTYRRLAIIGKSLEVHTDHCQALGHNVHHASHAAAVARANGVINNETFRHVRRIHRAAGVAKHEILVDSRITDASIQLKCKTSADCDPLVADDPWSSYRPCAHSFSPVRGRASRPLLPPLHIWFLAPDAVVGARPCASLVASALEFVDDYRRDPELLDSRSDGPKFELDGLLTSLCSLTSLIHARLTSLVVGLITCDFDVEAGDSFVGPGAIATDDLDAVHFDNYRAAFHARCRSLMAKLRLSEFRRTAEIAITEGQFLNLPPDAFEDYDIDNYDEDPLFDHHYTVWIEMTYLELHPVGGGLPEWVTPRGAAHCTSNGASVGASE